MQQTLYWNMYPKTLLINMENSIQDILTLRTMKHPLLALDLGAKRIGIALSDRTWVIASSLDVIEHKKFTLSAAKISNLITEHKACALVIGLPKNMDGSNGPRVQSIKDFARNFHKLYPDIPITFWDERLSTVAAEGILINADVTRKKRKTVIDKIAATYILQGFLDRIGYM